MNWIALGFVVLALQWPLLSTRAALSVKADTELIPERGAVSRLVATSDFGTFAWNPPPAWTWEKDGDESLVFRSERLQAGLSIRFFTISLPRDVKALRSLAAERWPAARVLDEAGFFARDAGGVSLDCVYMAANGDQYHSRIGLIQYAGGEVEIALTAPEMNFKRLHTTWISLLNSFRKFD